MTPLSLINKLKVFLKNKRWENQLPIQRRWGEGGSWANRAASTKAQRQHWACCGEQGRVDWSRDAADRTGEVEAGRAERAFLIRQSKRSNWSNSCSKMNPFFQKFVWQLWESLIGRQRMELLWLRPEPTMACGKVHSGDSRLTNPS